MTHYGYRGRYQCYQAKFARLWKKYRLHSNDWTNEIVTDGMTVISLLYVYPQLQTEFVDGVKMNQELR